mmetsp:Transcript_27772/g.64997  ORF Transcript_27772/g.64997 Transcript_27772/m.64997 type:complete len:273 (+) Transcript_27772:59-877(+)
MESEAAALAELEQQQHQLEEIETLLQSSPDDPSLLSLKADLLELIAVTTSNIPGDETSTIPAEQSQQERESTAAAAAAAAAETANDAISGDNGEQVTALNDTAAAAQVSGWNTVEKPAPSTKRPLEDTSAGDPNHSMSSAPPAVAAGATAAEAETTQQQQPAKKKKKSVPKEFVVPAHLQAKDTDSKAEENRKKRAIKALKNQWRAQRKDQEATKKQKSWQDFQTKSQRKKSKGGSGGGGGSMFATSTDTGAKVGVVGGRQMTDFVSRKRHK